MVSGKEALLQMRVTPGAKRNAVTALKEGVWHIKIAAPPVEGRANAELVDYLSDVFGLSKSSVAVIKGQTSRKKLVSVAGLEPGEITARLSRQLGT